jgi:hypothetical protein
MNCSDISLILDDCDTGTLDDASRKAVDSHVADCPGCMRDWSLHARLVTRRLPALPPGLLRDCAALAMTTPRAHHNRRPWNRAAWAAGVAVLAVAAATLVSYYAPESGGSKVASVATAGTDLQDSAALPNASTPGPTQDVLQTQVSAPPAVHDAAPEATRAVESRAFVVRLSTLRDDTLEAADRSVFDIFRSAVIEQLRRTPGLVLVPAESEAAGQDFDYEITLTAARRNGRLNGNLRVSNSGPNRVALPISGAFGLDCDAVCFQDATNLGVALGVEAVKRMVPNPAAQRPALLKELQDLSLPPQQRLVALRDLDLRRPLGRNGLRRTDASGDSLRDPAVVRAAIDLASRATDPAHRAEIWSMMRSIKYPALIEPLAHAAQLDADSMVRVEAVATLVADYSGDPRARTAFELIARTDSHLLVRALAQRGMSGETAWNSYVLASLENSALSDAQRLEAVLFQARNTAASERSLADLLDDDALKALTQVLPRAGTGMEASGVRAVLNQLASVKHPAITDMLLTSIERRDPRFERRLVMDILTDRLSEPGVRAVFEKIAASDPDEQSRRIAAQALRGE